MNFLLPVILSYVLLYKYLALFLTASIAATGVPLPLDMLTIAAGAFASQRYLSFSITLTVIALGNMVGDSIDYFIAKTYEQKVLREKYLHKYSFFDSLEEYIKNYAGLTIILTRFVGILSVPTNFFSGYSKMKFRKFIFYDFIGNLFASFCLMYAGYLVGSYWENTSDIVSLSGWIIGVGVVIFILYNIFFSKKTLEK